MKKNFFLKKSIDELSDKQLKDLDTVFGGEKYVSVPVYLPTRPFRCPNGMHWDGSRCVTNIGSADADNSRVSN